MKISKLFHWLYATLMFLPLIALPIFGIYSHRHTIDSGSIEVQQNKVVYFNQLIVNGDFHDTLNWQTTYANQLTVANNIGTFDSETRFNNIQTTITHDTNHIYYFKGMAKFEAFSDNAYPLFYVINGGTQYYWDLNNSSEWQSIERTFTSNNNEIIIVVMQDNRELEEYTPIYLKNLQLFDLTQMFGTGNEPTIQQFNDWFTDDYYSFTLSRKELIKDYSTITYNDSDIMSQFTYQIYNLESKYLNFDNVFGFVNVYDWLQLNIFNGNPSIYFTMFWHLLTYWLIVSLFWLVFDVLMYVPQLAHRWLDRGAIE